MQQYDQYADPDTASMITNWAQAKYAPSATGFYQPQPSAAATPAPGQATTGQPTSWGSVTGSVTGSATLKPPTIDAPPANQITAGAAPAPVATSTIGQDQLATRNVDAASETVQGRMTGLLDSNSQYMQQARADAMRSANERGMMNSAMAASGGTDAAIRSALPIATTDAGTYAGAADYNVALKNQATMWNADQTNQGNRLNTQMADAAAARAQAAQVAQMQNDTTRWTTQQNLVNSQWERQVADATTRYTAEMQDATSRYNTDANYRKSSDDTRLSMANNIVQNMDLSPDRKAAMLEALGQGTSAGVNPDGSYRPGTGLAGAVYVIGSVSQDLNFAGGAGGYDGGASAAGAGAGGAMNGAFESAANQASAAAQRESWSRGMADYSNYPG